MTKYHKSPKTGKWSVCVAKSCPYGDIPDAAHELLQRPLVTRDARTLPKLSVAEVEYNIVKHSVALDKHAYAVAPEGVSAVSCYSCGTYLPTGYWEAVDREQVQAKLDGTMDLLGQIPCPNPKCHHEVHSENWNVDVLHAEAKYWSADEVRKSHWFHVTARKNWLEKAQSGLGVDEEEGEVLGLSFVHVGSKEAAMHRLRDLVVENRQRTSKPSTYYLYEVKLAPETPVNPHVLEDVIDGWPEVIVPEPKPDADVHGRVDWKIQQQYQPDGVSAYVNRYEAPGTVSLIANPTKLVQVAQEAINF